MSAHPHDVDLTREPFADPPGIDPRVMARGLDPATGEIPNRTPASETRRVGPDGRLFPGGDVRTGPWPPRTGGPLPPADRLPPDLNITTAYDEMDAWAHEHNAATNELETIRRERTDVQISVMKARMKYRRMARASPTERGRRTADDIKAEVDESLASDPMFIRIEHLDVELEVQLARLFRAKDNISRLDGFIRSLPRDGNHRT